jgi:hypothetical protein
VRIGYFSSAIVMAAITLAAGWAVGNRLLGWIFGRGGGLPAEIGNPERTLAAIVGAVVLATLLMVAHILTWGNVFGNPFVVPLLAAGAIALGLKDRSWPRSVPWVRVTLAVLVLGALFVLPAVMAGSGLRTGDTPWHLGWTEQLLAGEVLPTGFAPEFARNAYPWGFHSVLATMVRIVPGSDPQVAHEALHILIVIGIPVAAASLARRLDRRAGWAGAGAAALVGGFGWIEAGGPAFVLSPSLARYGADLVVASPNSVYELFPPVLPRELGLVVVAAAGVVMALRVEGSEPSQGTVSGAIVGLAGLVSLPMFVTGVLWVVAAAVGVAPGRRLRFLSTALLSAAGVLGIWALPVVGQYFAYGGFVDVTPRLGVEWPLDDALWSWGLLLPLSIAGAVIVVRASRPPRARVLLAYTAATISFLALTLLRAEFGWNPLGNATLLHQGRVWPVVHLLAAAFAGVAIYAGWTWLRRASNGGFRTFKRAGPPKTTPEVRRGPAPLAVAGVSLLFLVGAISPVLASIRLTEWIRIHERGYLYSRPDLRDGAFVREAAEFLSAGDVVRTEGSDFLGFLLWQMSGARLSTYDDDRLDGNDARIRYKELAERWDERMASGGFEADYVAVRAADAPDGADALVSGNFRDETWVLIAATR